MRSSSFLRTPALVAALLLGLLFVCPSPVLHAEEEPYVIAVEIQAHHVQLWVRDGPNPQPRWRLEGDVVQRTLALPAGAVLRLTGKARSLQVLHTAGLRTRIQNEVKAPHTHILRVEGDQVRASTASPLPGPAAPAPSPGLQQPDMPDAAMVVVDILATSVDLRLREGPTDRMRHEIRGRRHRGTIHVPKGARIRLQGRATTLTVLHDAVLANRIEKAVVATRLHIGPVGAEIRVGPAAAGTSDDARPTTDEILVRITAARAKVTIARGPATRRVYEATGLRFKGTFHVPAGKTLRLVGAGGNVDIFIPLALKDRVINDMVGANMRITWTR